MTHSWCVSFISPVSLLLLSLWLPTPFPFLLFIPSPSLDIASTLPVPHHHYCMAPYRTIIARRSCDLMTVVLIPYLLDYYSYSIYTGSGHQEILWV